MNPILIAYKWIFKNLNCEQLCKVIDCKTKQIVEEGKLSYRLHVVENNENKIMYNTQVDHLFEGELINLYY